MKTSWLLTLALLAPACVIAAGPAAQSVGIGSGVVRDGDLPPCGYAFLHSDQVYENGYAFDDVGTALPYFGAFAEPFAGSQLEICALFFDMTTSYGHPQRTFDAYVWDDQEGRPGNVLAVVTGIDPGPIAFWPEVSRHVVPIGPRYQTDPWWAGQWGDWPGQFFGWYLAADLTGPGYGVPMVNIAPGMEYPSGWNDVSIVWGATKAMGIGFYGHTPFPAGAPENRFEEASWGRIKSLY